MEYLKSHVKYNNNKFKIIIIIIILNNIKNISINYKMLI